MSSTAVTLAIDQGTHLSRALLFDINGEVVAQFSKPISLFHRSSVEVEQNPDEIIDSIHSIIAQSLQFAKQHQKYIGQIGLATQRSSVVAWDSRTGKALSPVLSWQDRRAADWLMSFVPHQDMIRQHTGLRLSPHYGVSKLHWLRKNIPAVIEAEKQQHLALGPLASFILFHLLEGNRFVVDHANAARTLLWNITSCDWDDTLLKLFAIPRQYLPQCCPIRYHYGYLKNHSIPITAVNGDQTAALHGTAEVNLDQVWVNMGTGAFILKSTDQQLIRHTKLLSGIADSSEQEKSYVLEGTVNNAGSAIDWLSEQESIVQPYQELDSALRMITNPPLFMNTISGLGSPFWSKGPTPSFLNFDGHVLAALPTDQMLAAVAESILFLIQANLDCMEESHLPINSITISGGLAQSNNLCQKLANLSGLSVQRPILVEATARGIAWLATKKPVNWNKPMEIDYFSSRKMENYRDTIKERYQKFVSILQSN